MLAVWEALVRQQHMTTRLYRTPVSQCITRAYRCCLLLLTLVDVHCGMPWWHATCLLLLQARCVSVAAAVLAVVNGRRQYRHCFAPLLQLLSGQLVCAVMVRDRYRCTSQSCRPSLLDVCQVSIYAQAAFLNFASLVLLTTPRAAPWPEVGHTTCTAGSHIMHLHHHAQLHV